MSRRPDDRRKRQRTRTARSEWEKYERLVASLLVHEVSTDRCITPNAKVRGRITDVERQIDVLIDARHDTDNSRRIIVDAKKHARKIDVKEVEAFRGMMEDVGATHGYLICPKGHSEAAKRRAQSFVTICLLPLHHLQNFDPTTWPYCQSKTCRGGRVFWDGFPELSVGLVPIIGVGSALGAAVPRRVPYVHYVGKCDRCGRFHVYCLTCKTLLSFDDDDGEHACDCKMPWFWLVSIEQDEPGERSAELHVVSPEGVMTTDRRPVM